MAQKPKSKPDTCEVSLPHPKTSVRDAIEDHIIAKFNSKRPPTNAANILAIILELDKSNSPFPDRKAFAKHVGCSVWGLDNAINTSLTRGLITKEIAMVPGRIKARENVVQVIYIKPTILLRQIANPGRSSGEKAA